MIALPSDRAARSFSAGSWHFCDDFGVYRATAAGGGGVGITCVKYCIAIRDVRKQSTAQIKYGKGASNTKRLAAKSGPTIRARLPTPWATPIVAPCSLAGASIEIIPNTGGRVRLDPMEKIPRPASKHPHV